MNLRIWLLALLCISGVGVSWADTAIPLSVGSYLTTSTSVTTGTISNNDGGNLGSIQNGATATFTLTNTSAQDMVLTFLTGNNNSSSPQVTVTMNDGSSDFFTKTIDVENTGSWTPVTKHTFDVGNVPAGTITLTFAFTNTGSYVCNLGSIGVYSRSGFAIPGNIDVDNGSYKGPSSSNGDVGYVQDGGIAAYLLYNATAGSYNLKLDIKRYNQGGIMNVKIADVTTGVIEYDSDYTIASDAPGDYTTNTITIPNISTGLKTMTFTFSGGSSYICNYKNVLFEYLGAGFKDIAIDLRSGQLGTSGSNLQKYLTIDSDNNYSYADADPGTYNALLTANSFNGTDHGYVNFKAKVPVGAGIYKITLGTCQYGTGTGYVKNADESSKLSITNENGQTVTSFNQNTGACYHNGTSTNIISVWYQAASDETITIVCGNYTPYFAIEKVNTLPELQYTVTYVNNTEGASGTVPAAIAVTGGESITIPVNRTLYKDGYTLTGWNDGTTTHSVGSTFTPDDNVTLTAVFTANAYTLNDSYTPLTVRWDFQRQNGAPNVQWEGRTSDFLVAQTTVNGQNIDVKLGINTNSGKFNNSSWTDWCQVNEGTTFTFPSQNGSTVSAFSMNEPKNNSEVKSDLDGIEYSSFTSNIATYNTTNNTGTSTLTIKGGSYYRYIEVTYPVTASITGITELTVDGTAVGGDVLAAINTGDSYTATLSDNTYTTLPTVEATFDTGSTVTGVVSGSSTTRTYTFTETLSSRVFTLNIEGIHLYTAGQDDETVQLKYTGDGNDKENKIWSNGVYRLSPVGDGWNNSGFKLKASEGPFTLSVPSDVQVKQFIIHEFIDNYQVGSFNTITSTGMTTAYIPTKHNFGHQSGDGAAPAKYDLIINLDDHQAGKPITFSFTGGSQITGWYELTVAHSNPGTAPVKTAENVTVVNNHAVVAVTFDREIPGNVNATINGGIVTAEGGATTLYFPVWNLSYATNYSLHIAAGAVTDTYGNSTSGDIDIAVNVPAKAAVAQATYDYVVGTASEFSDAVAAVNSSNNSASAPRKTIFIKNGDYDFGSTEQRITGYNVSLIGESRNGVILHGNRTGISNPVLNIRDRSGFYLQDLTVKNDYDYGTGSFNGVAVAIYGGDKTVMKNVRMLSNQDTQVTGHRAYFENCEIHGTVDFICGGGDNFYWHTDLVLEDRGGNCITAPSTSSSLKWGYVFQECTIKGVDATAATTNNGSYTLGRPWQEEPRCYYLNTTMNVLPTTGGWAGMSTLPTHFYEYNSMNSSGVALNLSDRCNSSTSTNTYTPILSAEEAAKFTVENVLGGTDSWLPTEECPTLAAPTASISSSTLSWTAVSDARCYVIFKDGQYLTNQTATSLELTDAGTYTVRAANLNGGLGETSNALFVAKTTAIGWTTACIPYDAEVPEGTRAYYASAHEGSTVTFTPITAIPAGEGFIFNAEEGIHAFAPSASTPAAITNLLVGTTEPATVEANSVYVLTTIDASTVGMKLYSGTSIATGKAYLPKSSISSDARTLQMVFEGEVNGIEEMYNVPRAMNNAIYDLQGRPVAHPHSGIYISNGKKIIIK